MSFIKIGDACPITAVFNPETMDHQKAAQSLEQIKEELTQEEATEEKKETE